MYSVFKYLIPHRYYLIPKLNDILIHKTGVIKVYYLLLYAPVSLFIKLDTTYTFSPQHSSLNLQYLLSRPFILLDFNFQSLGLKWLWRHKTHSCICLQICIVLLWIPQISFVGWHGCRWLFCFPVPNKITLYVLRYLEHFNWLQSFFCKW
jgi:hypothetical protein